MRATVFLIEFLLLAAFFVISYQGPDGGGLPLSEEGNVAEFGKLYVDWMFNIWGNLADLTGYVVDADWLPNATDITNDSGG